MHWSTFLTLTPADGFVVKQLPHPHKEPEEEPRVQCVAADEVGEVLYAPQSLARGHRCEAIDRSLLEGIESFQQIEDVLTSCEPRAGGRPCSGLEHSPVSSGRRTSASESRGDTAVPVLGLRAARSVAALASRATSVRRVIDQSRGIDVTPGRRAYPQSVVSRRGPAAFLPVQRFHVRTSRNCSPARRAS